MDISNEVAWLFLLAVPIACISWTVAHEEVFKEPRTFFIQRSIRGKTLAERKFFYLLTCEFCFSHYVTIFMLIITDYTLVFPDWRGYLISGFSLVWVANIYMSLYGFLRVDLKKEKIITKREEKKTKEDLNKPGGASPYKIQGQQKEPERFRKFRDQKR